MSKYFTRKGDDGWTGLLGDERVPKNHPKPKAYGAVDEASAALGLARAFSSSTQVQQVIKNVQLDMYHLMAELAATDSRVEKFRTISPEQEHDGLSNPSILPYLNRLSSLCFVLSLYEEKSAGVGSPSTTKPEEK
jgi:cob(I)alamin adenosyltransferase